MNKRQKPNEVARELYLSIYKRHKNLTLEKSLDMCTILVDKMLDLMPAKIHTKGILGEEDNPEYVYWQKVKISLQNALI
jgi:hypothetical protein